MRSKITVVFVTGVSLFWLLAGACGGSEPPAAPLSNAPSPTPHVRALVQAAAVGAPTPTPVPQLERQVALDFAVGHRAIVREWDRFLADFNRWRESLIACDSSSAEVAFRGFAGSFIAITERARGLPRESVVRELANKVVVAAEGEEEAIRLLRDNWQPGDPTTFEAVDVERSAASVLRKEVEGELNDLQARTDPTSRALVNSFSLALQRLNRDWDEFHRDYDSFQTQRAQLTSEVTVNRLSELVDEFRAIAVAVRELPTSAVTRNVAQIISDAAEAEDLALRHLRGTFEKSERPSREAPVTRGFGGEEPELFGDPSAGTSTEGTFVARDPALFDAFDAQLVESNSLRRRAANELADVVESASENSQAAVDEFAGRFDVLAEGWDDFHVDYDLWRVTEGGCDRSEVVAALARFEIQFGQLANQVRELPRATFLRPLGELFVEAAELGEEALTALRNTWRPFDSEVYQTLEQERIDTKRLRRQVAVGVQDLLTRYGISNRELE